MSHSGIENAVCYKVIEEAIEVSRHSDQPEFVGNSKGIVAHILFQISGLQRRFSQV